MKHEHELDMVIAQYVEWLILKSPSLIADAKRELRGKYLLCWCAPKACHAVSRKGAERRTGMPPEHRYLVGVGG